MCLFIKLLILVQICTDLLTTIDMWSSGGPYEITWWARIGQQALSLTQFISVFWWPRDKVKICSDLNFKRNQSMFNLLLTKVVVKAHNIKTRAIFLSQCLHLTWWRPRTETQAGCSVEDLSPQAGGQRTLALWVLRLQRYRHCGCRSQGTQQSEGEPESSWNWTMKV